MAGDGEWEIDRACGWALPVRELHSGQGQRVEREMVWLFSPKLVY